MSVGPAGAERIVFNININMDEERSTQRGTDSRSVYPVHCEENGYSIQGREGKEKKRKQSTETAE